MPTQPLHQYALPTRKEIVSCLVGFHLPHFTLPNMKPALNAHFPYRFSFSFHWYVLSVNPACWGEFTDTLWTVFVGSIWKLPFSFKLQILKKEPKRHKMAGFCLPVSSGTLARNGKRARKGHTKNAEKNPSSLLLMKMKKDFPSCKIRAEMATSKSIHIPQMVRLYPTPPSLACCIWNPSMLWFSSHSLYKEPRVVNDLEPPFS